MILWRLLILAAVVLAAWAVVAVVERRKGADRHGLPQGLLIVTTEACRLCEDAVRAISEAGPELTPRIVDATALESLHIRSAPTVIVADRRGEIVLRRTGRSAIFDAEEIVRAARGVA